MHRLNPESFPVLDSMLASIIRLMSCFVRNPSESQIMTLLHLLECVKKHPDFENNLAVCISVSQSREIWEEQLELSRDCCMQAISGSNDNNLH